MEGTKIFQMILKDSVLRVQPQWSTLQIQSYKEIQNFISSLSVIVLVGEGRARIMQVCN